MVILTSTQKKALEIYHNEGHAKAWNYWKLVGNTIGIFLGEVSSKELIDGESLAKHIGLTEGVLCDIDTPWLKFILDGNIIYVAKKPLKHYVSWNVINECGAVFEDEGASITIGYNKYDITLLRGLNKNYNLSGKFYGYDVVHTHTSEWNRFMYPIHSGIHTDNDNPAVGSISYAQWTTYSDSDLGSDSGTATWVQETQNSDKSYRFIRGNFGVTHVGSYPPTNARSFYGWRPALRLLKKDP